MLSNFRFSRIGVSRVLGIPALLAILFVAGCGPSAPPPLAVTTTSSQLSTVILNAAFPSTTLTAANGTAPYTWTITSGALPTGMGLSSAGVVSGTPTAFGTFNFTVTVTDSATPTAHTATASLSVLVNPVIASVGLNPATVVGGTPSTATVTLNGAAAAAASVTLSSSSASATVPATVTVAAGATTATFQVTTTAVSASTPATITATYGVAKTATLTMNAPTVSSVALALSTVTGGVSTTGTVTLTGPAATGGDTVTLISNNAAAQVPATVTVAAGATSAQFAVTTSVVISNATATIQASFNSSTQPAPLLTVVPAPSITSFTPLAASITSGGSTKLTAVFSNGTGSVNNSVGAVTSGTGATVAPTVTTTYTLTVTNAAGTSVTQPTTVTVVPAPVITSFNSLAATITVGSSTTITGVFTGGTGSVDNAVGSVTSGTAVTVSPVTTTTYTLTVTNSATTPVTTTKTVTVTVVPAPVITSFTPALATIVSGTSTTLTAVFSNGTGTVDHGVGAVTSGTPVSVSPTTTTTYTLTVTNAATTPASVTSTTNVTVDTPPGISTAATTTFTVGTNGSFPVQGTGKPLPSLVETGALPGAVTFIDNGNGTGTLHGIPASGTDAGSPYHFTITASNGVNPAFVQNFTLNVVLVQAPAVTTQPTGQTVTVGNNATFTAAASGAPVPTVQWQVSTNGGTTFTNISGATSATLSLTAVTLAQTASQYRAVFTNSVNSVTTNAATLTVVPAPTITSFAPAASTITNGTSTTLTAVFNAGPGGNGSVDNSVGAVTTGTAVSVSPTSTTTYTLTVTNAAGTAITHQATVTVVPAPMIASFTATSTTIVSGNSTTLTPVFSNGTGSVNGIGSVTSGTGVSVSPSTTTTYTLTVTNAAGSKATSTVTITVNSSPSITSTNNASFTVGVNGTFTVTTTGNPTPALSFTGSLPSPITFVDNGNGTATISGIPTSASVTAITITASNGIGSNATQSFTLSVSAVSCSTNCTISGTVSFPGTASGLPISGLAITLTGPSSANTTTNSSGSYSFTGLTGGSYTVTVTPPLPGYTFSGSPATVVISGNTTTQNFTETPVVTTYSISGLVSYTGAQTGNALNTIISVSNSGCSSGCGNSVAGTSITSVPSSTGTAYTVRGLPPGSYVVNAEIDTQGTAVPNSANPNGSSATATISTSNLTGVNFTLADRTPATPGAPKAPNVFPSSGAALIVYNEVDDSNGEEVATSYVLRYATDAGFTNPVTISHPAGDSQDVFLVPGLFNGTAYYFELAASNATGTSAFSPVVGPITPSSVTSGGNTVSGTVTFTGITPLGRLNVGLYSGTNGVYFVSYPSPTSGQTFSISGVPSGDYALFAFLDQKGCNSICVGNVTNFTGPNGPPQIKVSGTSSGNAIALTSFNSNVYVTTFHTSGNGNPDNYGVIVGMNLGTELPISNTLYSAPNVGVPFDMNASAQNGYRPALGNSFIPTVGDPYEFQVTYANGSTQVIPTTVSEVLNTFATSLSETTSGVVGGVTLSRNVPEFTWAAPSSPPTFYTYEVEVYQDNQQIWFYKGGHDGNGLPSNVTSAVFNSDGNASQSSLTTGTKYAFSVTVTDNQGNSASFVVSYTP